MIRVPLHAIAHGRAGDKGDTSNISVIARTHAAWPMIEAEVTAARVAAAFRRYGAARVERFALTQLHALNFVIHDTLGGGVNSTLALDRHGKTLSSYLLGAIELDVAEEMLPAGSPYRVSPSAGDPDAR